MEGETASINGTTQIRAGVLRPEVVVARPGAVPKEEKAAQGGLEIGTRVRVIRTPWVGILCAVTQLPVQLQKIESEALVRVLEARLDGKLLVTVSRANVEILAE